MKLNHPLLIRLTARLVVRVIRFWYWIVRVDYRVYGMPQNPYLCEVDDRYLFSVWHDSLVIPMIFGRRGAQTAAALVSRHTDGSYLSDSLKLLGLTPIRGSTSRGGSAALKQLITTAANMHIFITPDGPRGPRREMKQGIVYLASTSGRPIVPTAFVATRSWHIKGSWTDMAIPQPFSKVYFVLGAPIKIPADLSREEIEFHTGRVQRAMDELNEQTEQWAKTGRLCLDDDKPADADALSKAA